MSDDLAAITEDLGVYYASWKSAEKLKNVGKDEFFKAINKTLARQTLAQKTVEYNCATMEDAYLRAQKYNPAWRVVDGQPDPETGGIGDFYFVLEERPEYLPFVFVNPDDHQVYSRSITEGDAMLDDEALGNMYPEILEAITFVLPWGEKIINIDHAGLDGDQLDALSQCMYPGKPKVRLNPPRAAKPEELEELE